MLTRIFRFFSIKSLFIKLIVSFVIVSLVGTILSGFLTRDALSRTVGTFLNTQEEERINKIIIDYYEEHGAFDNFDPFMDDVNLQTRNGLPPLPLITDANGIVISSSGNTFQVNDLFDNFSSIEQGSIIIEYQGEVLAYVVRPPNGRGFNDETDEFLTTLYSSLWRGTIVSLIISILLGVWLARQLTHPIQALIEAAQLIAKGNLQQEIPIRSHDEIGELTATFNQMSRDISQAHEIRKQMTADIAHDLRNPLLVISGYIESLRDEVLKPTPERFEVMHQEVQQLSQLVTDLRTLSLADSGELPLYQEPISVAELLKHTVATYKQKAAEQNILLDIDTPHQLPLIHVDKKRILQVLSNLVSNALRYTPNGGRIRLQAQTTHSYLQIVVSDTGVGIDSEDLPKIFDRFYRADNNRAQDTGESGLGLAIAKSIIEAHEGKITVFSEKGQGTRFDILLPLG